MRMAHVGQDKKRTYVTAYNATKRGRAKCVTVYGLTPSEVIALIRDTVRDQQRKAG